MVRTGEIVRPIEQAVRAGMIVAIAAILLFTLSIVYLVMQSYDYQSLQEALHTEARYTAKTERLAQLLEVNNTEQSRKLVRRALDGALDGLTAAHTRRSDLALPAKIFNSRDDEILVKFADIYEQDISSYIQDIERLLEADWQNEPLVIPVAPDLPQQEFYHLLSRAGDRINGELSYWSAYGVIGILAFLAIFELWILRPKIMFAKSVELDAFDMRRLLVQRAEAAEAMLNFSIDGTVSFDEDGIIHTFSRAAEQIFGYRADEMLNHPISDLLPSEDDNDGDNNLPLGGWAELALGTSRPVRLKHRNGGSTPVKIRVTEVVSDNRHLFVAMIQDITDEYRNQKKLQDALAEAEAIKERFQLCIEGAESAIWDIDLKGGQTFLAPRLRELLGYEEGEFATSLTELDAYIHPDDRDESRQRIERGLIGEQLTFDSEFRLRDKDGRYHWFHSKGALRRDTQGFPVRAAGSMTEITARVDAEDALRCHRDQLAELVEAQTRDISNSQARLVAAINAISDGFCLLDEDEKIVLVNEHMKEMHSEINDILTPGRSLAELSARMIAERQKDAYSDRDWANHFEQVRRGDAEDEMKLPNGKWVKITRARVPDGGLIILHTDVTRYKQQETRLVEQAMELEQALDKEKELNDLQRQFVSMASHEFRTPLAIIDSSAQLLTRDLTKHDADKPLRRVEKIRAAVLRMTNLIESTLTAARIDAGKIEINPQPFDMARLVREICDRQQEVAANHEFTIMLDGLPATIRADRGAIDQIITNLLTNAVKYAPDNPEVTITGWREGDDILLSVQDHGLGISAADQQHLFTRFFRAETSTGIAGTGIGLNLVRQLVTMHGGSITVDSAVGQGSTFTVRLPVSGPAEIVAATDVSLPLKAAQ